MQNNEKNGKSANNKKKRIVLIVLLCIITVALGSVCGYILLKNRKNNNEEKDDKKVAYTQLIKDIEEAKIEKIEMTVNSTSIKVKYKGTEEGEEKSAIIPSTQAFVELIQEKVEKGNEIELIQNPRNAFISTIGGLISFLPTIIMLVLAYMIIEMQGLGDKGKVYNPDVSKNKVTFKDVAGLKEEKAEMIEIVEFLKKPKKYIEMGARVPKGVLLCGKPGTGKTLIGRAIAGEANVPFISMSGSEFIEMFAGLGASRVRKLFEKAEKISPCIIFIDEIDAIGSRRTSNSGADTENNQTLNQLLVEMDGFDTDTSIIVMAATNRPEMLDEALLRPGRFDRTINIGLPDIKDREEILKIHSKNKKLAEEVNLKSIAEDTAGFSGAELENILNESAIYATNRNHKSITQTDIEDAVKKVTVGLEKQEKVVSEKDKKLTAYHEAGHALVSKFLPSQDNVKEVSIIPRGVAGGYTMYKSSEDKWYVSKTEMEEKMIALMGGRAAEKVALDEISTGASNDIEVAMKIARDMITVYGMSERIGPMSINIERDPYQLQLLGNNLEDEIGKEVREILENAYEKAQQILKANRPKLDAIAKVLLEKEKINEDEFNAICGDLK
ncbi:MAG: ATP-dependent zinc metalloprotease FtsH [Clostridia bacterium]|nr:ATP-dependent zinc metalloprotease FtsH [Clostridia bacterium]